MTLPTRTAALLILLATLAAAPAMAREAFPQAAPEDHGIPPLALKELAGTVQGYVDEEKVVGAELLVIKDRRILLHRAFGWKDREEGIPMEPDTLFNIRSMTKPMTGTAAWMLIDEGKLALSDPVAKILPSFDNDKSRAITVDQLLTHRSGLPMTLLTKMLEPDQSLRQIADQAGEHGPEMEPGTKFQYSDTGSDTLGAVVEAASGAPLGEFMRERILRPLGMTHSLTLLDREDPMTSWVSSAYIGATANWERYWQPDDDPIYPFAMGSQSVYSTPMDYARFLAFWMDGGTVGGERLLSQRAVSLALEPVSEMSYPCGFPGVEVRYGRMWMLWTARDGGKARPVVVGHGGSDGTWAWAWPHIDLMVLYFTQSRGQATGNALEPLIHRLLVDPGAEPSEVTAALARFAGPYIDPVVPWRGAEYTIVVQNEGLALQLPNQAVLELGEPDDEGRRRLKLDSRVAVSFQEKEDGTVSAMNFHQPNRTYVMWRGPAPPEPKLLLENVRKYLGFYHDAEAGHDVELVFRDGRLAFLKPGIQVPLALWPPDEEGIWRLRLNSNVSVRFNEDEAGSVVSYTARGPGGEAVRPRVRSDGPAPAPGS
jgi:CubicO group peptidase (beta-lactamase class C family)